MDARAIPSRRPEISRRIDSHAVGQAGLYPSNLRAIDNNEAGIYGVNEYEETLLILAFESADHSVEAWMARAVELIQDHGGRRHLDESAALRWRTAFIRMPYARELTVPLGVINDTFESAVTSLFFWAALTKASGVIHARSTLPAARASLSSSYEGKMVTVTALPVALVR